MNRTRLVFFGVLALALGIVAISLALQLISSVALTQLFVAATVFSVGVVALDFLGVLGGHHGVDADGGVTSGHIDGAHGFADHGADSDGAVDAAGSHGDTGGAVHDAGDGNGSDHAGGEAAQHTHGGSQAAPILSVLAYLRLFVYFCLGFGPVGLASMLGGRGPWAGLGMAVPAGLVSLFLAQAFFRFQRRDTGAWSPRQDLLSEEATVIVPLDGQNMGKVRVRAGQMVSEVYALAADGIRHEKGDTVRIVRVTEDCVHVS